MEVNGQLHTLAAFSLRKQPQGHFVGTRADLDAVEKRNIFPCREYFPDSSVVQPVRSLYWPCYPGSDYGSINMFFISLSRLVPTAGIDPEN
jgi:hypothetical protein